MVKDSDCEDLVCANDLIIKKRGDEYLIIEKNTSNWMRTNDIGKQIIESYGKDGNKKLLQKLFEEYQIPLNHLNETINNFLEEAQKTRIVRSKREIDERGKNYKVIFYPRSIWLHITNRCNLQCPYCYTRANSQQSKAEDLGIDLIRKIIQQAVDPQETRIILTGGEPLLRKDIIEILKECKKSKGITLLTNGTIGEETLYKKIIELVDRIQISLDGKSYKTHDRLRGSGSFQKAIDTINMIRNMGFINVEIGFTPTRYNIHELPEMVDFAYSLGVRRLHINQLLPLGRAEDHKDIFLNRKKYLAYLFKFFNAYSKLGKKTLKANMPFNFLINVAGFQQRRQIVHSGDRKNCGLGNETISIDSVGNVYPCSSLHVSEHLIGNIKETAFKEIYSKSCKTYDAVNIDSIAHCPKCDVKYFCKGGCRAVAYLEGGSISSKDPFCDLKLRRVKDTLWGVSQRS